MKKPVKNRLARFLGKGRPFKSGWPHHFIFFKYLNAQEVIVEASRQLNSGIDDMAIDKSRLEVTLGLIHQDSHGYYLTGCFEQLWSDVLITSRLGGKLPRGLLGFLGFISQDLWNIETVLLRLDWQRSLFDKGQLNQEFWMDFAKADIDVYHIEVRSIFDYLAKSFNLVSNKPGQVSCESFHKLRNWVVNSEKKEKNAETLGLDLAEVVRTCDWFDGLAGVRNSVVHEGAYTLVFPEKGRILFQVSKGYADLIHFPLLMFNDNVVDFELYAGLHTGYLISFLEEAATRISTRLALKSRNSNPRSYHLGLLTLSEWMGKVLALSN